MVQIKWYMIYILNDIIKCFYLMMSAINILLSILTIFSTVVSSWKILENYWYLCLIEILFLFFTMPLLFANFAVYRILHFLHSFWNHQCFTFEEFANFNFTRQMGKASRYACYHPLDKLVSSWKSLLRTNAVGKWCGNFSIVYC